MTSLKKKNKFKRLTLILYITNLVSASYVVKASEIISSGKKEKTLKKKFKSNYFCQMYLVTLERSSLGMYSNQEIV